MNIGKDVASDMLENLTKGLDKVYDTLESPTEEKILDEIVKEDCNE